VSDSPGARAPTPGELRELQVFVVRLGAAMNAVGETVYTVQERLARVAHAYHAPAVRISAFATFLILTMGRGEPATLELTSVASAPRLDQIASLDRLVREAERGVGGAGRGNALFGGFVSAFLGALVMTPVADWVSRLPSAMPRQSLFVPGYWLLVPGALGLIGLAQVAGDARAAGIDDLVAITVSLFAVTIGILGGSILLGWVRATGLYVGELRPQRPS
jgi:Putative threonine/serine exporter